ncbi:phytoene dehydrogenase [Sporocytophaga myxococcoides]|uniref:Phytoene dehydrogenase n=1 Tax=Sporocytophaga myxococcoides TaxID=153721 RepID=A0A098LEJ1_9BACT|nr:FAD-dependent oxidoreductase [Sporocytophaga myxococcoides]GAL85326.1 phytoene dehydrogenase [Sporocytophaga myxococcoides]
MDPKKKSVIILGGGIGGLSAAHELINRGFNVIVFESKDIPGGKARSLPVLNSGKDGRKDLPGEHGFRFFPRFYKHIIATMEEIPYGDNKNGVADNLVDTTRIQMARFGKEPVLMPARFPRSLREFIQILADGLDLNLGLSTEEKALFAKKVWQLMTSCKERRKHEYERISWWEYLDADQQSPAYQSIFAKGLTRTLVAARAEEASTKTGGDIFIQLLFDIAKPGISCDRVLCGPTNEVWIDPWLESLKMKGVDYRLNSKVLSINCADHAIKSVTISCDGKQQEFTADYYISAVPVEVMVTLLNDDLLKIDPTLNYLKTLSQNVSWMNGTQFYLNTNIDSVPGHSIYIDTPWALTSIYQCQFWRKFNIAEHGDGKVKGILSVDVSDWNTPGILYNKPAKECSKEEIIKEIWEQLKRSLNVNGKEVLKDEYIHSSFIDPDIVFESPMRNEEPLLVNCTNSWDLRPYAYTQVSNLFLASDYVKTNTDLATMEGANEAARRAVNSILDASGVKAPKCKIWDLHEPALFALLRWRDLQRYKKGLPWSHQQPFLIKVLHKIRFWFYEKSGR